MFFKSKLFDIEFAFSVETKNELSLTYSDRGWIQDLSNYATSSLLRAAKLGAEITESWVVENAATHLWNYSSQLLAAGQYGQLLPAFQTVVELLLMTDNNGYVKPGDKFIAGLTVIALYMMLSLLCRGLSVSNLWTDLSS